MTIETVLNQNYEAIQLPKLGGKNVFINPLNETTGVTYTPTPGTQGIQIRVFSGDVLVSYKDTDDLTLKSGAFYAYAIDDDGTTLQFKYASASNTGQVEILEF